MTMLLAIRTMRDWSAHKRLPILLCGLIALTAIAIGLRTASKRAEKKLQMASLLELETAVRRNPNSPDPSFYLGRRWLQMGNMAAAHAAFERAAHHASDNEDAWIGYAITTSGPNAQQDTAAILSSYLKLHSDSVPAHHALLPENRSAQMEQLPGSVSIPLLLRDADALRAQKRLPEAKSGYMAVLALCPDSARACEGAGLTSAAQGNQEEAFLLLERAADLDERLPQAQFVLGNWLLEAGFKKEAARRLALAAEAAPQNARYWHTLGQAYGGQDVQSHQAEEAYRRASNLDPTDALYLIDLAEMLVVNNRMDEAEQLYRRAVQLAPHDADALSRLGAFLLDSKPTPERLQEADRMLKEALRLDQSSDFAWYHLGRLAYLQGDDKQAIQALQRAVTLVPQIAEGWYALYRAFVRNGNRSRADIALHNFHQLQSQYQERTHTSELLDLHPRDYVLHLKLAREYKLSGENAKAIFEYGAYLRFHPEDAAVQAELNSFEAKLKMIDQLPSMSLFIAMVESSLKHGVSKKQGQNEHR